ncbi:hypothetical protein F9C11_20045 [Amycolatopsis sp. VS8301801F10]|uniref:hypothetical protein n=1 Tax=unclassified Amycolatopsis TaxID=2618356 RepID=UPI0038FCFED6
MTAGEVAAANLAGRLHRSQRGAVLDGLFWAVWVFAAAIGAVGAVAVAESGFTASALVAAAVGVAAIAGAVRFSVRRRAEFREPLTVIAGPAHDFGAGPITDDYPIGLKHTPRGPGQIERWQVRAGGRTYPVPRAQWDRLVAERITAVCVLANGRCLVNIVLDGDLR